MFHGRYKKNGYNCIELGCTNKVCQVNRRCNYHANLLIASIKDQSGSNNPNYKKDALYRENYFCKDCGKPISAECGINGLGRCRSCANNLLNRPISDERKYNLSLSLKRKWQDPIYSTKMKLIRKTQITEEVKAKIISGQLYKNKINSLEQKILNIINKHKIPLKYYGDGSFILAGLNPDFANKRKKKILEVYYEYFKIKQYGSEENYRRQRFAIFRRKGFDTKFLSCQELKYLTEKEIVHIIKKFIGGIKSDSDVTSISNNRVKRT